MEPVYDEEPEPETQPPPEPPPRDELVVGGSAIMLITDYCAPAKAAPALSPQLQPVVEGRSAELVHRPEKVSAAQVYKGSFRDGVLVLEFLDRCLLGTGTVGAAMTAYEAVQTVQGLRRSTAHGAYALCKAALQQLMSGDSRFTWQQRVRWARTAALLTGAGPTVVVLLTVVEAAALARALYPRPAVRRALRSAASEAGHLVAHRGARAPVGADDDVEIVWAPRPPVPRPQDALQQP